MIEKIVNIATTIMNKVVIKLFVACLNYFGIKKIPYLDKNKTLIMRHINDNFEDIFLKNRNSDADDLLAFIENTNLKGRVAFDVGANIGVVTTFISNRFDEIYSFEPVSSNIARLEENSKLNCLANISIFKIAFSDTVGEGVINLYDSYGHHSLGRPDVSSFVGQEKVSLNTIDNFMKEHGIENIDYLKIDVEGFEDAVLKGAKRSIEDNRIKVISFEISDIIFNKIGKSKYDVIDFLLGNNFQIFNLKNEPLSREYFNTFIHGDFIAKLNEKTVTC